MSDHISASRVLQLLTWISFLPILLLNLVLILSIRRERSTDNRFRWFNSMFLYSTYSNTLLLTLFTAIQPVFLPARSLIYLVFIGPVAWVLPRFLLKLLYCIIVGVASYQLMISPISLFLRWLVVTKRISCLKLHRNLVGLYYGLSAIPLSVLSLIFLSLPALEDAEDQEDVDSNAVLQLTGSHYGFVAARLGFSKFLLIFSLLITALPITYLFHKLFMKTIRNLSNDLIDLGYHDSATVSFTFLWFAGFNSSLITLPHLILTVSVLLKWQLGVRAITVTCGFLVVPLISAILIFCKFRAYRRQAGFLVLECLESRNVDIPIAVIPNTTVQVEIPNESPNQ